MRTLVLLPLFIVFLCGKAFGEELSPKFFGGGPSDISSRDSDRALKAIRKWSSPSEWDEQDPTEAPYFWDFEKVGREVFLRVLKIGNRDGKLEVWLEDPNTRLFEHFKTYQISYYSGKPGPKTKEGDLQAPEGFYYISRGRMNPASSYHLSMDIGYPNAYDRHHGRTGSLLMIHGKSVSLGCFAMTDASIEQIYTLVDAAFRNGQKIVRVHSFPFVMSDSLMAEREDSEHFEFWENLKEGWDWFEKHKVPPNVEAEEGRYVFSKLR